MQDNIEIKNKQKFLELLETKLKVVHVFIALIVLVVFNIFAPITKAFVERSEVLKKIDEHEKRITRIENEIPNTNELLQEIKFNLKNYMLQTGHNYIEIDKIQGFKDK